MIVVLPIVAAVYFGTTGFGVALLINFIVSPVTVSAIRDAEPFKLGKFSSAVNYIFKSNRFLIFIFTIANVSAILLFAFQTLINPWLLVALFSLSILTFYFLNKKNKDKFKLHFRSFCIAPLIINSFFIANYIFSSNPVQETYHFQNDIQPTRHGQQEGTYIYLENNAYSEYPTIRTFFEYEEMRNCKTVTYTFQSGLFGLRVTTHQEFTP